MARVAFYAPMKPPTHPVPSGDREMARNLMAAIGARGTPVDLVSELRVHDSKGDATRQADLARLATAETQRLTQTLAGSDTTLWVTYHSYYKSPDLIGPAVCAALNLPYVQIESTRARSRLTGPWADFAAAAETAADAANVVFYLTSLDLITLERDQRAGQQLIHLRPFLPQSTLPFAADCTTGPMISVGMMRERDKLASYRIIAETLSHLRGDWRLDIVGDGPARPQVQALMAPFGDRVRFLGQLDRTALAAAYANASLFFWPGVNEAYGMVYLEAQAAGLPVVAQDRTGVCEVVLTGTKPPAEAGALALAESLDHLLANPDERQRQGTKARELIARNHLSDAATQTFWSAVIPLPECSA